MNEMIVLFCALAISIQLSMIISLLNQIKDKIRK